MTVPGYLVNLELESVTNADFRRVLFTAPHSQLVAMSLGRGEATGPQTHADADQFIRVNFGHGKVVLNGEEYAIADGWAVVLPAGTEHNIVNTSRTDVLRFHMISSFPRPPAGIVHEVKACEAEHC